MSRAIGQKVSHIHMLYPTTKTEVIRGYITNNSICYRYSREFFGGVSEKLLNT